MTKPTFFEKKIYKIIHQEKKFIKQFFLMKEYMTFKNKNLKKKKKKTPQKRGSSNAYRIVIYGL